MAAHQVAGNLVRREQFPEGDAVFFRHFQPVFQDENIAHQAGRPVPGILEQFPAQLQRLAGFGGNADKRIKLLARRQGRRSQFPGLAVGFRSLFKIRLAVGIAVHVAQQGLQIPAVRVGADAFFQEAAALLDVLPEAFPSFHGRKPLIVQIAGGGVIAQMPRTVVPVKVGMGGKRGDLVVAAFQIGPVGNQEAVEGLHAQHGRYQGAQPPQGNHGELLFQIIGGGELHRVIQQPRRLLLLQNTVLQRQADHAEAQQGNDENDDGFQHDS